MTLSTPQTDNIVKHGVGITYADVTPKLKIFISFPGSVREQRYTAVQVLTDLVNTRTYRDAVSFQVVHWDKPQLAK